MNQDQVKELLISLEECKTDFSVTFSGKESKKVNGLYKPLTKEILIHNKNFENDGQLIYTAIHEYTHHLESEKNGFVPGKRVHGNDFWAHFHSLLEKAEEKSLYTNPFDKEPSFIEMTERIRKMFPENGKLMLEFGKLVVEAEALCRSHFVRFEDYIDRAIGVPRNTAQSAMKAYHLQVPPELGWDAMKMVSAIKKPETRTEAINAFMQGKSSETVKALAHPQKLDLDPKERLAKERLRLERTIQTLQDRLSMIEQELSEL